MPRGPSPPSPRQPKAPRTNPPHTTPGFKVEPGATPLTQRPLAQMAKKSSSATDEVHWLNLRYTETQCPGLHQALESAPNDQLSALARGIIYQWFLHHEQAGTLTKAVVATLAGPGATGQRSLRRSSRPRKNTPRLAKVAPLPSYDGETATAAVPPPALEAQTPPARAFPDSPTPAQSEAQIATVASISATPAAPLAIPKEQIVMTPQSVEHDAAVPTGDAPDTLFTFFE